MLLVPLFYNNLLKCGLVRKKVYYKYLHFEKVKQRVLIKCHTLMAATICVIMERYMYTKI